jgi:hypothetical protein
MPQRLSQPSAPKLYVSLSRLMSQAGKPDVLGGGRFVLAYNHAALSTEVGSWEQDEIWDSLRLLISDHRGVKIEQVVRDASFVDDFGV